MTIRNFGELAVNSHDLPHTCSVSLLHRPTLVDDQRALGMFSRLFTRLPPVAPSQAGEDSAWARKTLSIAEDRSLLADAVL
jgi:hypothetical protein